MKFTKIFKRTETEGVITLTKVVDTKLTEEQFNDLFDYFQDESGAVISASFVEGTGTLEVCNKNELLEDAPLPDGVIVLDKDFETNGYYIVVLGDESNKTTVVGVTL